VYHYFLENINYAVLFMGIVSTNSSDLAENSCHDFEYISVLYGDHL
jgi:hypothetical protein